MTKEEAAAFLDADEAKEKKLADARAFLDAPDEQAEGMWSQLYNKEIPLLTPAVEAVRTGIPGAIAEGAGAAGASLERAGFPGLGSAVGTAGALGGTAIGMAGELVPKNVGEVALTVAGGAVGRGIGATAVGLMPPLAERAPNVVKAVKAAMSANILPTVAQITQNRFLASVEEMAAKIPFVGKRISFMREAQDKAFNELRAKTIEKAGPSVAESESGAVVQKKVAASLEAKAAKRESELAKAHRALVSSGGPQESIEKAGRALDDIRIAKTDEARKKASKLYKDVGEEIPDGANIVMPNKLSKSAADELEKYKNLPSASLDPKAKKLLEDLRDGPKGRIIENSANPVMGKAELEGMGLDYSQIAAVSERSGYTFEEMQTLRSTLNGMIQQERLKVPAGQMTPEGALYKKLKSSLDSDIEGFSEGLAPALKKKFEVATAYYRDHYKGVFANKTMATLGKVAKDNPDDVYKLIFKPGDVSDMKRLKAAVGDKALDPMRRRFVRDLVTADDGRILTGAEITGNLAKYGDEAIKEALTPSQLADVRKYVKTRELPKFLESEVEKRLRRVVYESGGLLRAPDGVVQRIINGDEMTLKAVKRIVGPKGMKPIKRDIIESILGRIANPEDLPGVVRQPTAGRIAKNLEDYDPNFLKAVFSDVEMNEIKQIDTLKALFESQQRLGGNPAGTAGNLLTGAGLVGAGMVIPNAAEFIFKHPIKAAVTVLTPDIVSRLYVSEAGRRLLIKGLDPKWAKNGAIAGALATQISIAAAESRRDKSLDQVRTKTAESAMGNRTPGAK